MRILIVEDQDDLSSVWSEFLRRRGHDVVVAGTCALGLELVGGRDVAVIDWTLPDGPAEPLLAALSTQGTPVVLTTGHGEDVTEVAKGRVRAVLRKPFKLKDLDAALRSHAS